MFNRFYINIRRKRMFWINSLGLILLFCGLIVLGITRYSADTNSYETTGISCHVDLDCNDGVPITTDTCENPNTTESMCRHKMNQPAKVVQAYPSSNLDEENFMDTIDVLASDIFDFYQPTVKTDRLPFKIRTGNLATDIGLVTNTAYQQKGKLVIEHDGRTTFTDSGDPNKPNPYSCGLGSNFSIEVNDATNHDITANQIDNCTATMVDYYSTRILDLKNTNDGQTMVKGFAYDEFRADPDVNGRPNFYSAMAKAWREVKKKYPAVSIYIWSSGNAVIPISVAQLDRAGLDKDGLDGAEIIKRLQDNGYLTADNLTTAKLSRRLSNTDGNIIRSDFHNILHEYAKDKGYSWSQKPEIQQIYDLLRGSMADNGLNQVNADLFKATDYIMQEMYLQDWWSSDAVNGKLSLPFEKWQIFYDLYNFLPGQRNLLESFGAGFTSEGSWADMSSGTNYARLLDLQFKSYKDKINEKKLDGIAAFHGNIPADDQSIVRQLFDHYITQDQNDLLFGAGVENNFVQNTNFEATNGWQFQSGTGGSIDYFKIADSAYKSVLLQEVATVQPDGSTKYRYTQWPRVKVPETLPATIPASKPTLATDGSSASVQYFKAPTENHLIELKKGTTTNTVSQPITNLTPGQLYQAEVYSKKMTGDYGNSGVKTKIQTNGDDFDAQYKRMTFPNITTNSTYAYKNQYAENVAGCAVNWKQNGVSKCNDRLNLWTREEMIFRAPAAGTALTLSLDDSAAALNDVNVLGFIQLQAYEIPQVEARADEYTAKAGDTVTYTVEYHNYSNTDKIDFTIGASLDSGLTFVSASNGGSLADGKVSWTTPTLKAGESLFYTYKVTTSSSFDPLPIPAPLVTYDGAQEGLNPPPPPTTHTTRTFTYKSKATIYGTKTAGVTKVLVNNTEATVDNNANTWTLEKDLALGSNTIMIVGKDDTGQTSSATTKTIIRRKTADANNDGNITIIDFGSLMSNWLKQESNNPADFNEDGSVNLTDFGIMMSSWGG